MNWKVGDIVCLKAEHDLSGHRTKYRIEEVWLDHYKAQNIKDPYPDGFLIKLDLEWLDMFELHLNGLKRFMALL